MPTNVSTITTDMTPSRALRLWSRGLLLALVVVALFMIDAATWIFMDKWMFDSLSLGSVFSTNFKAGLLLYIWGSVGTAGAVALPLLLYRVDPAWRAIVIRVALIAGLIGGYLLASEYREFLTLVYGGTVGEADPVFGNDLGYYLFKLEGILTIAYTLLAQLAVLIASLVWCAAISRNASPAASGSRERMLGALSSPVGLAAIGLLGLVAAYLAWLQRFNILYHVKATAPFFNGADYVDVTGLFSTVNYYRLTALLLLVTFGLLVFRLRNWQMSAKKDPSFVKRPITAQFSGLEKVTLAIIAVDLLFAAAIATRQVFFITPNEPVVQLDYISRHRAATSKAWGIDKIEVANFKPAGDKDPLPTVEEMMASPTLKNAPLWPGYSVYLERLLDPQHARRVLLTAGDGTIYSPSLDEFRQLQALRMYYQFMDVDNTRYTVNGEKKLMVSGVREAALFTPQDFINHWGQRTALYTHGYGLVAAQASSVVGEGEMDFLIKGIPPQARYPELKTTNDSVYYGNGFQGSEVPGFVMSATNLGRLKEFDHPTVDGVAVSAFEGNGGVPVNTMFRKLVIGWRAGNPVDFWFSSFIGDDAKVHYYRRPLERIESIAPFLFVDANATAVIIDERIQWLVNGVTTSNMYPYSWRWNLGDKASDRHYKDRPVREVNYARDAVKAVLDASSGHVTLYKFADEPVVDTWAHIYPDMFKPAKDIPENVRKHLQYPKELFHAQIDDLYILYHMTDPTAYFQLEDMWDDADEVLGPIISEGDEITFSIEPSNMILDTGAAFPAAKEKDQFAQYQVFTNEGTANLRSIVAVYQDGEDYGRMVSLNIPKGEFFPGPEQIDAIIDQEPEITQEITWWSRLGSEVIRGHTTTAVVGKELIFIEPLFTRSKQNPIPQLKRVIVVLRGQAVSAETLSAAVARAIEKARREQTKVISMK